MPNVLSDCGVCSIQLNLLYSSLLLKVCWITIIFLCSGLDEAYKSFNASAAAFLESNAGLDSSGDHQVSPRLPIVELVGKNCALRLSFSLPDLIYAFSQREMLCPLISRYGAPVADPEGDVTDLEQIFFTDMYHCSGSVTFWYGSGSVPLLVLTNPAPDPALFVSDLQDANNFFLIITYFLKVPYR